MDERTRFAVDWLVASEESAIRYLAYRDLIGDLAAAEVERTRLLDGPKVRALLAERSASEHPYKKWTGAHWRLVSLVELGVPAGEPRAVALTAPVLEWLISKDHRSTIRSIGGLARCHASQEGNALAVCCRLGQAADAEVRVLAESLMEWQWPDGGWNCDLAATGRRSSFHESLAPAWGLHEYWVATGDAAARAASLKAAELFLAHRVFRSLRGGKTQEGTINPSFVVLHYPPYWHYDALQAMVVLSRIGVTGDGRVRDALDLIERRRLGDGRWRPGVYWWNRAGRDAKGRQANEVVDWGRSGPNEMITLNALRALVASGRI
jgi:hypothetical protein